jgi:hypothetical protein
MACSQGALAKLLVEPGAATHTFDASSEIYDFLFEDIRKHGRLVGGRGIAGTRAQFANRMVEGSYFVGGTLATYTCAADLDLWLPRILGADEVATDTFNPAETLQAFGVMIDRVSGVFQYNDCYINRAVWRGKAGPGDGEPELVQQVLEIMGKSEDATVSWPGTPPTLSTASNRTPYILSHGVLTIGGTPFQFKDFVLLIDNHLEPRWVNSLTATAICPSDRTVLLRATLPFTAANDAVFSGIYKHASRHTGVTSTLVFTPTLYSGLSTTITLTGLQWVQESPVVQGKTEIELTVDFVARKTGSGHEIVVVNDSTVTV